MKYSIFQLDQPYVARDVDEGSRCQRTQLINGQVLAVYKQSDQNVDWIFWIRTPVRPHLVPEVDPKAWKRTEPFGTGGQIKSQIPKRRNESTHPRRVTQQTRSLNCLANNGQFHGFLHS